MFATRLIENAVACNDSKPTCSRCPRLLNNKNNEESQRSVIACPIGEQNRLILRIIRVNSEIHFISFVKRCYEGSSCLILYCRV